MQIQRVYYDYTGSPEASGSQVPHSFTERNTPILSGQIQRPRNFWVDHDVVGGRIGQIRSEIRPSRARVSGFEHVAETSIAVLPFR